MIHWTWNNWKKFVGNTLHYIISHQWNWFDSTKLKANVIHIQIIFSLDLKWLNGIGSVIRMHTSYKTSVHQQPYVWTDDSHAGDIQATASQTCVCCELIHNKLFIYSLE